MDSNSDSMQAHYQSFFEELSGNAHEHVDALASYLEPGYGEEGEQIGSAGVMEHPVLEIDEDEKTTHGYSTKLSYVILNVKQAIRDPDKAVDIIQVPIYIEKILSSLPNDPSLMTALHILLLLLKVGKLSKVKLTTNEVLLLRALALLELEEKRIRRADLEQHMRGMISVDNMYDALINLESLGCVILTMDEVIVIEKIKFRVKRNKK